MFTKDSNEINFNMRRRYRQAFNKQTQREGYAIKIQFICICNLFVIDK